jgi:hypothetical protein
MNVDHLHVKRPRAHGVVFIAGIREMDGYAYFIFLIFILLTIEGWVDKE